MRTKQIFIILAVLGLLATLTTSVFAASSSHPTATALVGTWKITVPESEGNPEAFEAFHTYFADGNFVEVNTFREPNHGVWIGSGNTYLLTFGVFTFDEQGKYNGKVTVYSAIKMDGADHLTAQWSLDTIDLEGKVTKNANFGTYEGTRMEVQLPELP